MKTSVYSIIMLLSLSFLSSCSDDEVVENPATDIIGGEVTDTAEVDVPMKICTNWNATMQEVQEETEGLTLVVSEDDFMKYYSEKSGNTVSYEFVDNLLSAVAVILPNTDSVQKVVEPIMEGYNFIGNMSDSISVYTNVLKNTFAAEYKIIDAQNSFVVVGFTPL